MMSSLGKFISFEGIEGAGKTTALQFMRAELQQRGIRTTVLREPGGTPIAEEIRTIFLKQHQEAMTPEVEALLMFAGRAQNINQIIVPALKRGDWVLCDRFTDSTVAYQGGGRQLTVERIVELAKWVHSDFKPDYTILLDTPVAVGLNRVVGRGTLDRIELEGSLFFERVRHVYLTLARQEPKRFHVISTDRRLDAVQRDLIQVTNTLTRT